MEIWGGRLTPKRLERQELWRLWCDALARPADTPIADGANFFESGGDSLAAMMLHAAVEEHLQQHVELADVLDVVADADFNALAELVRRATAGDVCAG